MANPREQICAAVAAQLRKIRLENGYQTDAGRNVYRIDLRGDQVPLENFPAIVVVRGVETYEFMDGYVYTARLPFDVVGISRTATDDMRSDLRDQDLNVLVNDAIRSLIEDPTFGGTCKDSHLQNCPDVVDADAPEGVFVLRLETHYKFTRGTL